MALFTFVGDALGGRVYSSVHFLAYNRSSSEKSGTPARRYLPPCLDMAANIRHQ